MNVAERLPESLAAEIAAAFPEGKVHGARLFATHALADHAAFAPRRRAATRAFQERVRAGR